MRRHSWSDLIAVVSFVFALTFTANARAADSSVALNLKPQSHVWLTGDSTLHPYGSTATVMSLEASFQPPVGSAKGSLVDMLGRSDVVLFKVVISVNGLKSGEKGLDKNMYKALKAEQFPNIEFRLTDKRLLPDESGAAGGKLKSTGTLSVAGKENVVQLEGDYAAVTEGIHVVGEKKILMTDYGVKPPTIMGMIKTRNEVVVHFDLYLSPTP